MGEGEDVDRRRGPTITTVIDRLDRIETRLSRIEGGLVLAGFLVSIAAALLGALHHG